MKVRKRTLLLLACIVWMIAGFNVLRIGIITYTGYISWINICLSVAVFVVFWFAVFNRLTVKHTRRIQAYEEEKQFFLKFFDVKSFCIMAVMITGGILIRTLRLLPDRFIAVFYTGLGTALFLAGVKFGWNYIKSGQAYQNTKEDYTMKKIMNAAVVYFVLAMAGGVFFREFTKLQDFTGATTLRVVHVHLLVLGTLLWLILAVVCKITNLSDNGLFRKFFVIYNIALPLMAVTMLARGIVQVTGNEISRGMNGMLSGIAGISHIGMAVSLVLLLISIKKNLAPAQTA